VNRSSPDSTLKPSGTLARMALIWAMLPLASFSATMLGTSESRLTVLAAMFEPVRLGTLYTTMGMSTALAIAS